MLFLIYLLHSTLTPQLSRRKSTKLGPLVFGERSQISEQMFWSLLGLFPTERQASPPLQVNHSAGPELQGNSMSELWAHHHCGQPSLFFPPEG